MSVDSGSRDTVLDWIRASGLLLVTVLGILLYIVFSVPATIFYGRLGTTPGEVGITYSSLLSGSTFGILVILIVLTLTFFAASFIIAFFTLGIRVQSFLGRNPTVNKFRGKSNWQLTDEEFEQRVAAMCEFVINLPEFSSTEVSWDEEEPRLRRIRELQIMGIRTADQQAELDTLTKEREAALVGGPGVFHTTLAATERWIKRQGKVLLLLYPLFTVVAILPGIAYIQAGQIMNGNTFIGNQLNFFDYRAELVSIMPASETARPDLQSLAGKRLFFLGQNSQDIVFYSPTTRQTIRVPSAAVVVTSIP